jgi:hypothetical protein
MVRFTPEEKLWDHLVHTYHYLGHPWIVGSCLKYMAYLDGRLVVCLGWGSASWKVACRDSFIGWGTPLRRKNLSQMVNKKNRNDNRKLTICDKGNRWVERIAQGSSVR